MTDSLRLTPFEQCMVFEHSIAYPCYCFMRLHFQGNVCREHFELALADALRDHPLLRATLQPGRKARWAFPENVRPQVSWRDGTTGGSLSPAVDIDLHTTTGMHVFVVQDVAKADITFQFHHACCDGAGIDRFAEDFLVSYAGYRGGQRRKRAHHKVDSSRLISRGSSSQSWRAKLKWLPKQLVGLVGAAQFCGRRPQPVVSHSRRDRHIPSSAHYPSQASFRFDSISTLNLRKSAVSQEVAFHELVVRDFFLALWEWQKELAQYNDDVWIRMMVPINMRNSSYRSLPAINCVSSIFLDRRGTDGDDPQRLLKGIQDEMNLIKKYELKHTFLILLKVLSMIPGAMKRSVQRDACKTTVVFSSLGKWLRRCPLPRREGSLEVGDLRLLDIDGFAPIGPYNCLTVFTSEYANRLKINLHFDAEFVNEEKSKSLMRIFVSRLHDSANVTID